MEILRLSLHVLAATVWVGGQLVLAGLVPVLRAVSPEAPKAAARQFNRIAWPAYGVLVLTGIWNVAAGGADVRKQHVLLAVKVVLVALSGVSAFLHTRAKGTTGLAVWGALAGLSALATLFVGVALSA